MIIYTSALILLSLCSSTVLIAAAADIDSIHPSKLLSRQDFSNILFRAINDDNDATLQHFNHRQLREQDTIWNNLMQHGWNTVKSSRQKRILRSENSTYKAPIDERSMEQEHPFLMCSSYPNQSGYLRLQQLVATFNTSHAQTVYNTEETSCFILVTTSSTVEQAFGESYIETGETRDGRMDHVTFGPLVDVLKFAAGTPGSILNDNDWVQPVGVKSLLRRSLANATEEKHWSRSFMVDLVPGSLSPDQSIETLARDIISHVSAMANAKPMSVKPINSTKLAMIRNVDVMSTREAFSLTSSGTEFDNIRQRSSVNSWSSALEQGFESEHGCANMFDLLEVRPRGSIDDSDEYDESISVVGFELILNSPQGAADEQTIQSSAWNKQCAMSLIIGLSVHPAVQTIEIAQQLELASVEGESNPQWITQSGVVNSRPFFDHGLDGSGQVVAVADGGLDRDNCYFRDADGDEESIFGGSWDMSKRKIVNYDDTFGDRQEISMGHGTYVSGIIAGRKSSNGLDGEVGYADGVATGAKLSFFDMEIGAAGIQDPGVSRLFESFYNDGSGAKIMNGSWGRSYGGLYTSFCRDWDGLLRSKYADVLFVVSAGNTGIGAVEASIQNPADCKNAMAVGASLSYGRDIRSKEKGIEYMADYSSRGPSADGRIKPDIVAPGHFIVAPNADPSRIGECDGSSRPNVQYSLSAGKGGRYVSGTSMSTPVVAGSAAIVRQYFEEGWCAEEMCCGSKGCGEPINPSGSLLKAILLNGAESLTGGVQVVPDGSVTESVSEYDNNQGYGRLNLLNSLPLNGENDLQMIVVNDKGIRNEATQEYVVDIDMSNGCSADLRVTLAWFDAPGSVGCTSCIMNDLDLYIEEVNGSDTFYPNGLSRRDRKNTVERIRVSSIPIRQINHASITHSPFNLYFMKPIYRYNQQMACNTVFL
jgi:subtilisin family serine protease